MNRPGVHEHQRCRRLALGALLCGIFAADLACDRAPRATASPAGGAALASRSKEAAPQGDGEWRAHYANGRLAALGRIENERQVGTWRFWYSNGRPMFHAQRGADGTIDGYCCLWTPDGEIVVEGGASFCQFGPGGISCETSFAGSEFIERDQLLAEDCAPFVRALLGFTMCFAGSGSYTHGEASGEPPSDSELAALVEDMARAH